LKKLNIMVTIIFQGVEFKTISGAGDAERCFHESGKTAHREQFIPNPKARLHYQVQEVMRFYHYSFRKEEAYVIELL
jgi:hypothetical protein